MRVGERDDERSRGWRGKADQLGPLVALSHLRAERRDAGAGRKRRGQQRERRAALLLAPRTDHAVGRAGADDGRVRREVVDRLGEVVRQLAVLGSAEQCDEIGRALQLRAAHAPCLIQRRRRVAELREGAAGAHPALMDG